ncbi:glucose/arabinose dehydrogenase [Hamadaea flava]|uniref:Carbohydrate-binding protein n=1 Tax=Hamadaea flava TaxID=1742688 RepID=A0ABV8LWM8_9ACTN|nr:carbohydrate-binding protein [Hamadaea flava]MCP2324579.1 glucose/arabinose dehydrogenase [Hamadaea flava]
MNRSTLPAALVLAAGFVLVPLSGSPAVAHTTINAADYQQVEMARGVAEMGEPMSLAVLPDTSVLHTARDGKLRRTDAGGTTTVIATLPVYSHDEEGLQGVGVDPNFAANRAIFLYYAPPLSTPAGDAPATGTDFSAWQGVNRLSRFTLNADWTLNLASEKVVLSTPADRGICCHVGGDIDFDAAGNLYLTTGDDSNPFSSAGYAPIDERADRNPAYDAQRTAANTNDLRGKLLRIKVADDGTYTIPAGNLFAPGTAKTRPEIYAMGFRNPFRMSVDKATGVVYLGDYGPDAGSTDANRGPAGQVEFNRISSAGNYGWPYCTGTNTSTETYNEWNFATDTTGPKYACSTGPTNNSFRNTGLTTLPAARPAWIRYGGDAGTPPEFGTGSESPMGGPVYHYNAASTSTVKFPAELDGHFFAGEFGRGWIKAIDVDADGTPGAIANLPWTGKQVMDLAFGPNGALYVLDYGTGYFNGDANSALYRIEYIAGADRAPVAQGSADKTSGLAPLTVAFSAAGSADPEGGALTYNWAFGDGTTSTAANPSKTYAANGQFTATLTVRDPAGNTGSSSVIVTVGNTAPTVRVELPANGALFSFGDTVPYQITVTDPEDGTIDCARVKMTYVLGHDNHGHAITSQTGCSGAISVPVDGEHDDAANIFGVFDAEYTDNGANGQPTLTTHAQNIAQPRHRQAEHYTAAAGINQFAKATAEGGKTVGDIHNGDWIAFDPYAVGNAASFVARASSAGVGGTLQVRTGSPTGPLIGQAAVPVTGAWDTFTTVSGAITNPPAGTQRLYLVFAGGAGALFDLDSITFVTNNAAAAEGESYTSQSGVGIAAHAPATGGKTLGYVENGDWAAYAGISTTGAVGFSARISSNGVGGTIQIRSGSPTGTQLGSVAVPVTGGWETFQTVSATLTGSASGPLYLVFSGGSGALFDLDNFTLNRLGSGATGAVVGLAGKCVDVAGANTADGTHVQLYTCNGTTAQRWAPVGQTWRSLGKCLDISGGNTANGSVVQLWTCNGTGAQNWVAQADGTLRNPQSGRCLDVPGGSIADATQLIIYDCTAGANQKWTLP